MHAGVGPVAVVSGKLEDSAFPVLERHFLEHSILFPVTCCHEYLVGFLEQKCWIWYNEVHEKHF